MDVDPRGRQDGRGVPRAGEVNPLLPSRRCQIGVDSFLVSIHYTVHTLYITLYTTHCTHCREALVVSCLL